MGKHSKKSKHKHKHKHKHDKDGKKKKHEKELRNPREGGSLLEVTAEWVVKAPLLFDVFPPIIAEIDRGASISVEDVGDKATKEALGSILKKMQVVDYDPKTSKYSRISPNIKANKVISSEFLLQDHSTLIHRTGQSLSPGIALSLVMFFPDLLPELPTLLEQLLDNKHVDVSGMTNVSLKQGLLVLLRSLGAVEGEEGVGLERGRVGGGKGGVKLLYKLLLNYSSVGHRKLVFRTESEEEGSDASSSPSSPSPPSTPPHSLAPSAHEEDEREIEEEREGKEEGESEDERELVSKVKIGPQLPSQEERAMGGGEEEEEEGGPKPYSGPPPSFSSSLLGTVGVPLYDQGEGAKGGAGSGEGGQGAGTGTGGGGREEWILNPGQSKALKALGGGEQSLFQSRGFDQGKQAKRRAEQQSIQSSLLKQIQAKRERGVEEGKGEGQEGGGEEDEERMPSLLEEHMVKKQKREEEKRAERGDKIRRPFDRERDVLGGRKLQAKDVLQLAEHAKELQSKFDTTGVQRNFL